MRRRDFETLLCEAIRTKVLVTLWYKQDAAPRLYQPEGVYHSTSEKVCVTGVQIRNPNKFGEDNQPHTFEVAEISDLRVTDDKFLHPLRFDRFDPEYRNGIISSC